MNITKETDYAIRIVHCLCRDKKRKDAKKISEETNVSTGFALKILGKLASAGLVNSFKGNGGGYEIAKKPQEITLADVVNTIEGSPKICHCVEGECGCLMETACPFNPVFREISDMVNDKLSSINFGEV